MSSIQPVSSSAHPSETALPESTDADHHLESSVVIRLADAGRATLILGIVLRLALALLNSEANDDHLSVVRVIAEEDRLPERSELWQAYQPKLFHLTAALLWELGPWTTERSLEVTAQLLSCAAGILTLYLVRMTLDRWHVSERTRFFALAFVALNPKLIGLSGQATNDSFVIFFVTLTLASGYTFLQQRNWRLGALTALAAVGSAFSKGNGLVVFAVLGVVVIVPIFCRGQVSPSLRRQLAQYGILFVAPLVLFFSLYGPYHESRKATGSYFSINVPPDPLPPLIEETYRGRPGTTSVLNTFFTFRFIDLLAHPVLSNDPVRYPQHRTSLWSQLYGRTAFVHFDQWPPSWAETSSQVVRLGRMILLLAILPASFLVIGLYRGARFLQQTAWYGRMTAQDLPALLLTTAAFGYLALSVVSALKYHDFATMKAAYVFPGLLGFLFLWCSGADSCFRQLRRWPMILKSVMTALVLLLGLQVVDIAILLDRLASQV